MGKVTNIRQADVTAYSAPVKATMFAAMDEAKHTLAWGPVARAWMLESKERGLIRTFPNLIAGLSALERASGYHDGSFTVMLNPYW